ncbi:MAG: alkaline phosphatase family protein, partial [Candidatus Micrarchaeia archaeon]
SNVIGFSKFVEEGKIVESESVIPPVTGIAWPSIYTGLPPGRHGAKMEPFNLLVVDVGMSIASKRVFGQIKQFKA